MNDSELKNLQEAIERNAIAGVLDDEPEDIINHPKHYNRKGAMQCLDEMELVFGREAVKWFSLLNCWKYRYRAADKNGDVDISKSDFYMDYYKKLLEKDKLENGNKELDLIDISHNNTNLSGGGDIYCSVGGHTVPLKELIHDR